VDIGRRKRRIVKWWLGIAIGVDVRWRYVEKGDWSSQLYL
jgi:hypothetical protein